MARAPVVQGAAEEPISVPKSSGGLLVAPGMCVANPTEYKPKTASKASSRAINVEVGGLAGEPHHAPER